MAIETTGNYSLDVKRIFLSFAQQYFAKQAQLAAYVWEADVRTTPIVIVDKNAVALEVIEKRPSIVLSRGSLGWVWSSLGQHAPENRRFSPETQIYTDLLRGSLTYNCIAKFGIQAEEIANYLFLALSANKIEFRKRGIHQITGLHIGEEQIIKGKVEPELSLVPVVVQYTTQKSFRGSFDFCNTTVYVDDEYAYQGSSWYYNTTDEIVFFKPPPSGDTITVTYIDAITLLSVTDTFTGDGSTTDFTLTGTPSCTYPMFENISISGEAVISGIDS